MVKKQPLPANGLEELTSSASEPSSAEAGSEASASGRHPRSGGVWGSS